MGIKKYIIGIQKHMMIIRIKNIFCTRIKHQKEGRTEGRRLCFCCYFAFAACLRLCIILWLFVFALVLAVYFNFGSLFLVALVALLRFCYSCFC